METTTPQTALTPRQVRLIAYLGNGHKHGTIEIANATYIADPRREIGRLRAAGVNVADQWRETKYNRSRYKIYWIEPTEAAKILKREPETLRAALAPVLKAAPERAAAAVTIRLQWAKFAASFGADEAKAFILGITDYGLLGRVPQWDNVFMHEYFINRVMPIMEADRQRQRLRNVEQHTDHADTLNPSER